MARVRTTRRRSLTAIAAGTAGIAGCLGVLSSGDDGAGDVPETERWPTALFDVTNSNRRPTDVGPAGSPEIAWSRQVLPEFPFHPIVRGQHVYATGNGSRTLYALDTESGEERWTRTFDATGVTTAMLDGTLYACSGASIRALDPTDGGQVWRRDLEFDSSTLLAPADDGLYVGLPSPSAGTSTFASFATDSGDTNWERPLDARTTGFALGPDRVYVTTTDPAVVVALDRGSGDEVWRTPLDVDTSQVYTPTFDEDRLYVGGLNFQSLYALDAASGDELWRSEIAVPTGATLTDGGLIVGGGDGTVTNVDRDDGSHGWQRTFGGTLTLRPVATPSAIYVGQITIEGVAEYVAEPVRRLDPATGETSWQVDLDRPLWTSFAATSHGLFGALRDGTVFRLS